MNARKITATVIHTAFENAPRVVATVEIPDEITDVREAAEYAYRWTNNIEGSWSLGEKLVEFGVAAWTKDNEDYNKNVTVVPSEDDSESEYGQRSTSMGDIVEITITKHGFSRTTLLEVAMVGFKLIDKSEQLKKTLADFWFKKVLDFDNPQLDFETKYSFRHYND